MPLIARAQVVKCSYIDACIHSSVTRGEYISRGVSKIHGLSCTDWVLSCEGLRFYSWVANFLRC